MNADRQDLSVLVRRFLDNGPDARSLLAEIIERLRDPHEISKVFQQQAPMDRETSSLFIEEVSERFPDIYAGIIIPPSLLATIAEFVRVLKPRRVLDPWAVPGQLAALASETCSEVEAVATNSLAIEFGKVLAPRARWGLTHPLNHPLRNAENYDMVVSIPPLGLKETIRRDVRMEAGETAVTSGDVGNMIALASSLRLKSQGMAIYIVPKSFFGEASPHRQFRELGLYLAFAFTISPGTFPTAAGQTTYLVGIRKGDDHETVVGEFLPHGSNGPALVEEFFARNGEKERQEGETLALVDVSRDFHGVTTAPLVEHARLAEQLSGLPRSSLGDYVKASNYPAEQPLRGNTVLLSRTPSKTFAYSAQDPPDDFKGLLQLTLDSSRASASYVANLLNSGWGRQLSEYLFRTYGPNPSIEDLLNLRICLPSIQDQEVALKLQAKIDGKLNELAPLVQECREYRARLFEDFGGGSGVQSAQKFLERLDLQGVTEASGASWEGWIESLPFPLASILRTWMAAPSDRQKEKYEHLLHFFEAAAEFLGTVLLSAWEPYEAEFAPHRLKLQKELTNNRLSLKRSTFGTWVTVTGLMGKKTRELLADHSNGGRDLCAAMFQDESLLLPTAISAKAFSRILAEANNCRNAWVGHSGVVGEAEAAERNEKLLSLLGQLRNAFGGIWSRTLLVSSVGCKPRSGKFESDLSLMMGSNSEFIREAYRTRGPLDVESLHLLQKESGMAFALLPFVTVGPSPQHARNACYFFNRVDKKGPRYVSYHFEGQPELFDAQTTILGVLERLEPAVNV